MKQALKRAKNKGMGLLIPLFFGILAGFATLLLVATGSALLLAKANLPASFSIFMLLSLGFGSFVFGLLHARQHRQNRFFCNAILALVCGCTLLLLRLLYADEPFSWMTGMKLGVVMLPMFFSAFLVNRRQKSRFTHSRRHG